MLGTLLRAGLLVLIATCASAETIEWVFPDYTIRQPDEGESAPENAISLPELAGTLPIGDTHHDCPFGETVVVTAAISLNCQRNPDFNGDNAVGLGDFFALIPNIGDTIESPGGFDPTYDLNADGAIGLPDFSMLMWKFGSTICGRHLCQ